MIHSDYQKSYHELLDIKKDVNIHQQHLRALALEVLKALRTLTRIHVESFQ